jgi:two-component system, NtrC family, response regulator GlrR
MRYMMLERDGRSSMFLRSSPRDESAIRSSLLPPARPAIGRHALEKLLAIAPADSHILIVGPRTIDKAGCARIVHEHSARAAAPMVSVNCAEIASRGWEGALFGQIEMPTGATQTLMGDPLASAEGGTLFLDEVSALSLPSQVKLLRFLEEKQYRRLAETVVRRADVRVVGATDADLSGAVRAGLFRQDLLAKFQAISVAVPILRRSIAAFQVLLRRLRG